LIRCGTIHRWNLTVLAIVAMAWANPVRADERSLIPPHPANQSSDPPTTISVSDLALTLANYSQGIRTSRLDLSRKPRVSHSHRPLRQVVLIGGDRLVGECLDWGTQSATFRLQSGEIVSLPVAAVASMANSPGEVDFLVDSFETPSSLGDRVPGRLLDESRSADGKSSLRIDATSPGYRVTLDQPLTLCRIEFSFQIANHDHSTPCGEWQIEWEAEPDQRTQERPFVIRIGSDQRIAVTEGSVDSVSQNLKLSDGWHSFVALIAADRTRLIVDESILESRPTPKRLFKAIHFRPVDTTSKNVLWIDELQIRKTGNPLDSDPLANLSIDRDSVVTESGNELFGKILGITDNATTLETLGKIRSVPLNHLSTLNWHQPSAAIRQIVSVKPGVVARVFMQPFVDRPACEPEQLTVTILSVDSRHVIAQHALMGEITLRWSDILRIDPLYFGQSVLIDARRFHLGNSIRTDFHRQLPDGTQLRGEFFIPNRSQGQYFFSMDVAELEAAGPDAPRATPFLAELRAGNLITELFVNDQNLGPLNPKIRFKPTVQNPERIRMPIPRDLLKQGSNSFLLRQQPLKKESREFDDAEVGNFRLDIEP